MKKWGKWLAVGMVLLVVLSGCGSRNHDEEGASNSSAAADTQAVPSSEQTYVEEATREATKKATKETAMDSSAATTNETPSDTGSKGSSLATKPGFSATDSVESLNMKLIYRANVTMEVKDFGKAQSDIRNLVTLTDGYIVEFSDDASNNEKGGYFTIKVPASGFSSFLDQLDKMNHVDMQRSIQGQDVSEEYVDLESRLKVKLAMEERYLKFVNEAMYTDQLVEFAYELERIQTEIEQIRGRMRYIDNNVLFSTIEIRLYQPLGALSEVNKANAPLFERAKNALNGSLQVLSLLFQWLVIFISAALPVLLIAGVIVAIVWAFRRRSKGKSADE
ncbi:hypothetical protein D3C76_62130 [compost metagenome]